MEGIDAQCAVVLKNRTAFEASVQIGDAGFTFIKDRSSKKRGSRHVEHHFGKSFGCFEEIVRLEAADRGQGVCRAQFRDRDHVVWLRIDLELSWIKVLQQILVA